ncbi:MAG: hypothetical protein Q9186_001846 [Xanthomendoza sp. 1 TL-2023]
MDPGKVLGDDPFQSEDTQRLYETIDELRSCGINDEIKLPEFVVVGDQSCGKSSLLQSLTGIPFPVADSFCTQFPIRIVSRRALRSADIIKVSIEPALFDPFRAFTLDEGADERVNRLKAYSDFAYSKSGITPHEFRDVVDRVSLDEYTGMDSNNPGNQAKKMMSVGPTTKAEDGMPTPKQRNFSWDILKIEVSGPRRSHFSILDLPGVSQYLTRGLMEVEKIDVRSMVASFMMPKKTLIICVASATDDLANQAAFDMASEYDPQCERTIGVITKCDMVISFAQNRVKRLEHGWFVVWNQAPSEADGSINSQERHYLEMSLFNQAPWTELAEAQRGIRALKSFLAGLLHVRVKESFLSTLTTIPARKEALRLGLGDFRVTTEDKRAFLASLAQQFYTLTSQGLGGRYSLDNHSLQIRKDIREANDRFTYNMTWHGNGAPFQSNPGCLEGQRDMDSSDAEQKPRMAPTKPNVSTPAGGLFYWPVTKGLHFYPFLEALNNGEFHHYQTIFTMAPYMKYSPEEIRLNDYLLEARDRANEASMGFFANSSSPANPAPPSGLFTNSVNPSLFAHPAPPSSLPINPAHSSRLFEYTAPAGSLTANSVHSSGLFATPAARRSLFPNKTPPSAGLFENTTPSNSLCNNLIPSSDLTTGLRPSSSLFGNAASIFGFFDNLNPSPSLYANSHLFQNPASSSGVSKNSDFIASLAHRGGLFGSGNNTTKPASTPGFSWPSPPASRATVNPIPRPITGLFASLENKANPSTPNLLTDRTSLIYAWIREEIKKRRGTELPGNINPDVLPALFHRQIANWRDISTTHFLSVTEKTVAYVQQAAREVCGDKACLRKINTLMHVANKVSEDRGLLEIRQRVHQMVSRPLQTQNPLFAEHVVKARRARFRAALERYLSKTLAQGHGTMIRGQEQQYQLTFNPRDVASLFDEIHMSNTQNLEDDIHDMLQSYYELALRDFIEFVTQQVVESYLRDPKGPVLFFNPTYINSLEDGKIDELGAEDPDMVKDRMRKVEMLQNLGRAEAIALKYI